MFRHLQFHFAIEKVISMHVHVGGLVGKNTIHLSSYTSLHCRVKNLNIVFLMFRDIYFSAELYFEYC